MSEPKSPQDPSDDTAPADTENSGAEATVDPTEQTSGGQDAPVQSTSVNEPDSDNTPSIEGGPSEGNSESAPRADTDAKDATEPLAADERRSAVPPNQSTKEPTALADSSGRARTGVVAATVVAIAISAAMVGSGGYYMWQRLEQSQEQMQAELAALMQTNQQQQQALSALTGRLQQQRSEMQETIEAQLSTTRQQLQQQLQSRTQQQEAQLNRLQDRVDGHQQRLQSLSTTSREDWLLAEAEYLLKLANQRVLLERLPSNAIALLEAADAIIKQVAGGLGDAELFAVREALAEELSALKLIDPVDKEGIYLQLNALARAIDNLPRVRGHTLAGPTQEPEAIEPETDQVAQAESWWERLWAEVKDMAGILDEYIKIEPAEAPAQPLVDQYTSQAAVLNVRLLLEQAQVALLKEQPVAYRQSLQQAQSMLDEYFIESPQAREVRQSLQRLQAVEIAPPLPDISDSLKMLNGYIRQLHKLQPAAEGQL